MKADCHIHMVLDGYDWKKAMGRHREGPDEGFIRQTLARYQSLGYTYLRDGGDRLGASALAKKLAPEYGITYRTPLAPLHRAGHYGSFIGLQYDSLTDYYNLVLSQKAQGADFVKIMASGLMDFDRFGVLTEADAYPLPLLYPLVEIAHRSGLSVMVHCNGARAIETAADAGADSIEHGAYADRDALCAMKEKGVVWVPTLSTISNLLPPSLPLTREVASPQGEAGGRDMLANLRHDPGVVQAILDSAMENVRSFAEMGGMVAPGTDAGAHNVPHGSETELPLLRRCGLTDDAIAAATARIIDVF